MENTKWLQDALEPLKCKAREILRSYPAKKRKLRTRHYRARPIPQREAAREFLSNCQQLENLIHATEKNYREIFFAMISVIAGSYEIGLLIPDYVAQWEKAQSLIGKKGQKEAAYKRKSEIDKVALQYEAEKVWKNSPALMKSLLRTAEIIESNLRKKYTGSDVRIPSVRTIRRKIRIG